MRRPLHTFIVDDEWLIRSELQRMLQPYPEIQIVGEASNYVEALRSIQTLKPDLLFLDIHIPGGSGFALAEAVGKQCHLIFVTAFAEQAQLAQKYHALDFLLKPISKERLQSAILKVRNTSQKEEAL